MRLLSLALLQLLNLSLFNDGDRRRGPVNTSCGVNAGTIISYIHTLRVTARQPRVGSNAAGGTQQNCGTMTSGDPVQFDVEYLSGPMQIPTSDDVRESIEG